MAKAAEQAAISPARKSYHRAPDGLAVRRRVSPQNLRSRQCWCIIPPHEHPAQKDLLRLVGGRRGVEHVLRQRGDGDQHSHRVRGAHEPGVRLEPHPGGRRDQPGRRSGRGIGSLHRSGGRPFRRAGDPRGRRADRGGGLPVSGHRTGAGRVSTWRSPRCASPTRD